MTCKCAQKIDEQLKPLGLMLDMAFDTSFDARLQVSVSRLDGKRGKTGQILATYCPFCGVLVSAPLKEEKQSSKEADERLDRLAASCLADYNQAVLERINETNRADKAERQLAEVNNLLQHERAAKETAREANTNLESRSVRIIVPSKTDPFRSFDCQTVDVGHSDHVLVVRSAELEDHINNLHG